MDIMQIIIFSLVIIVTLVTIAVAGRKASNKRILRFRDRAVIDNEEFYQRYYKNTNIPKGIVFEVLTLISKSTGIPVTKIRPSDRFDKELAPTEGWETDDGISDVIWYADDLRNKAKISKPIILNTVDDLILYVAEIKNK